VEQTETHNHSGRLGDELAEITNGIVGLFREYYGRGPTRAKSYMLEDRYVVTILRDTLTTVERTLAEQGHISMVREVRLTFQEAMAGSFKGVVEQALGRKVVSYHSQILVEPDVGFEFFLLDDRP
jgi:uncharacterized protein YbcI